MPVSPNDLKSIGTDRLGALQRILAGTLRLRSRGIRVKQHCFSLASRARTMIAQGPQFNDALVSVMPFNGETILGRKEYFSWLHESLQ